MTFKHIFSYLSATCLILSLVANAFAQDKQTTSERIESAAANAISKQKYVLAYKLQKGQELRWNVEHTATTKTQMAGESEETSSRSQSIKLWKVANVDSVGNMTFVHTVESANMWHKIGDADAVTFDSTKNEEHAKDYAQIAKTIGSPLASITINSQGQIVDRKTELGQDTFGFGDVVMPLPKGAVSIGHDWYVPKQLTATDENGARVQLKARVHYELTKVKMPNAYVSFRTQVLTPIESETVKSQLMQKLNKGYLVFDLVKGIPVLKEIQWDEKSQGYQGRADSYLNYVGKLTEKLMTSDEVKRLGLNDKPKEKVAGAKNSTAKPVMRK